MINATITKVMYMPTRSASLSCWPNVRIAYSFSHSGVRWMKVVPSELIGDDAVDSAASHTLTAEMSSAMPIARPMATRPTRAETARPGCQGPPGGLPAEARLGVGREVVVMRFLRYELPFGWPDQVRVPTRLWPIKLWERASSRISKNPVRVDGLEYGSHPRGVLRRMTV